MGFAAGVALQEEQGEHQEHTTGSSRNEGHCVLTDTTVGAAVHQPCLPMPWLLGNRKLGLDSNRRLSGHCQHGVRSFQAVCDLEKKPSEEDAAGVSEVGILLRLLHSERAPWGVPPARVMPLSPQSGGTALPEAATTC